MGWKDISKDWAGPHCSGLEAAPPAAPPAAAALKTPLPGSRAAHVGAPAGAAPVGGPAVAAPLRVGVKPVLVSRRLPLGHRLCAGNPRFAADKF